MTKLYHRWLLGIPCLVLCTMSAEAIAPGDVRIALVIGNATYTSVPPLANSANDAKAMSNTLRSLGFTVIQLENASRLQMNAAIKKTSDALKNKMGVGLLYYAGHGLQLDAHNYMVPVDAKIDGAADIHSQTVNVADVIEAFKIAGNRMNIVVLDACRDNPFGEITSGKGLAPLDAPSGTFLAYATAPGNVAEDGDIRIGNGLYTQYLLKELTTPKSRIEDVFKRVRFSVRKASEGRQIPWESTSLEDDFSFNEGTVVPIVKPTAEGLMAEFDEEKKEWDRIKASTNTDDLYAFLHRYPSGTISEAVLARIDLLKRPALIVQGASADRKDIPYSRAAYTLGDEYESMLYEDGSTSLKIVQQVTSANGNEIRVTTNGDVVEKFDLAGRSFGVESNGFSLRYDPPQDFLPADLIQVGQSWKFGYAAIKSTSGSETVTGESKVISREKLTVGAGTFDTFKIESITYSTDANGPTRCQYWISQNIPTYLKMECTYPGGKRQVSEMSRMKRGS